MLAQFALDYPELPLELDINAAAVVAGPAQRTLASSPMALAGVGLAGVDRLLVRHSVVLGRL